MLYAKILNVNENDGYAEAYNANNDFRYTTGNTHFDEANLYYHVNRIATFFRGLGFNEFTQITAHAHYDYGDEDGDGVPDPNAEFTPSDHHLRFSDGEGVSGFNSFAREDKVIYHEYTHAVSYYIKGLQSYFNETGAINEGNSDYFAGSFTGRTLANEYCCAGYDVYQRNMAYPRIANFTQYNNDDYYWVEGEYWGYHEPHLGGELWSACLWDIRNDLTASVANEIIYDGLYAIPSNSTFLQYRKAILDADVFDNNGTHLNTITHDFYFRGIGNDVQTVSGTLQSNQTWSQYVQLSGNVYVPSGKTLTIASTATVNLLNGGNHYSIVSTGGSITLQSGATINGLRATLTRNGAIRGLCGLVQTAVNTVIDNDYGNSYYLAMPSGTFSENLNISNKYAVYMYGAGSSTNINGSVSVTNCEACTFAGFSANALSVSGSPIMNIEDIYLDHSQGNQALYAYNCTNLYLSGGHISDRYAYMYGTGISLNQSSTTNIDDSHGETLIFHNVRGLLATSSTVYLDYVDFCTNTTDLMTGSGGWIDGEQCGFSGGIAHTSGSNIYLFANRSINCSGLPKQIAGLQENSTGTSDILPDDFIQINSKSFDLAKRIRADISANKVFDKNKYREEYIELIKGYNDFINNYPASEYSKTALVSVVQIYRILSDYDGMNSFLQKILADKNLSYESGLAKRFLIDYYSSQKDFSSAINTADDVLSLLNVNNGKTNDTSLTCDVLYAKGYIYSHDLDDKDAAIKCFSNIISNYPDNSQVTLAENELGLLGVDASKIAKEKPTANNNPGFSTSSYPNPFNPTTIINYTLPDNERVVIKVYDILGREVKELMNEQKSAGTYSVEFDGSKLSSGVYFYTIKAGRFSQTKKMMLTK